MYLPFSYLLNEIPDTFLRMDPTLYVTPRAHPDCNLYILSPRLSRIYWYHLMLTTVWKFWVILKTVCIDWLKHEMKANHNLVIFKKIPIQPINYFNITWNPIKSSYLSQLLYTQGVKKLKSRFWLAWLLLVGWQM